MRIQSDRGIALHAANRPIITRGFDPFDSSASPEANSLALEMRNAKLEAENAELALRLERLESVLMQRTGAAK